VAFRSTFVPEESPTLARDPDRLRTALVERFPGLAADPAAVRLVRAPGRVNLIGEHTDYNDGLVLPAAIDLQIGLAFVPIDEPRVEIHLAATGERAVIDLEARRRPSERRRGDWTDYVAGTAWALREAGGQPRGFVGLLASDLPEGHGLSSSAALELASAWALAGGQPPLSDPMAVAQACRRAENEFVGVPCGLMDQFASAFGQAGAAILLDCRSLDHRAVALPPEGALLIAVSGVPRGLRSSAYGERRAECARAREALTALDPSVQSLRDARPALLDEARANLDEAAYRRARHVIAENERVLVAVRALDQGDLATAGRAFLASHASLRDDFEVSTPELDRLVEVAAAAPGVFGARLTGAGFGGAVIVLTHAERVAAAVETIRRDYRTPAGDPPEVRRVWTAPGAGVVAA
jgi:galactokinase